MVHGSVASLNAGRTVLVVEDEAVIAFDLQTFLGGAGYRVVGPVGSITEALNKIAAEKLDGAVLDPGVGGATVNCVADALEAAKIPYVFVTGHAVGQISEKYRGHPFLNNPYDYHSLLDALRGAMAGPSVPGPPSAS
jgi:CheY-like chemotaxis protein